MGVWKDWQIGMIESGATPAQITAAEARIKGTSADPLVRRLTEIACIHGDEINVWDHWSEDTFGAEFRIDCGCPCAECREF